MKPINVKVHLSADQEADIMSIGLTRVANTGSITKPSEEIQFRLNVIQEVSCEAPGADGKFKQVALLNLDYDHSHIDEEGLNANAVFIPSKKFKHVIQINNGCYIYQRGKFFYFDFEHEKEIVLRVKVKLKVKAEPLPWRR